QNRSGGEITLDGKEIMELKEEYRSFLGYLPQNFGYYPEFTAQKFLLYMSALKGLNKHAAKRRIEELLDVTGLEGDRNKKIKTFSGGMKRRLGIAQAMLNNPKILILDEPTAGLDPKERVHFRNLISSFSKDKIVLLSTHIVSDIEYIADEILVMREGKLIRNGEPGRLLADLRGKVWECLVPFEEAAEMERRFTVGNLKNEENGCLLRIVSETCPVNGAKEVTPSLEDIYLYDFQREEEK
ncbi:MAG TPA: ATP-binding cassette domain-containing protein, partial [Candidatus Sellimonas avistercoris]|nr:ATP-binding cassette domain-containing protein [Candidatus Sellimonas avistercoris]